MKIGHEMWRMFQPKPFAEHDGMRATVTAIDDKTITCLVVTDVPRSMKFDRETGIHVDGFEFGYLIEMD